MAHNVSLRAATTSSAARSRAVTTTKNVIVTRPRLATAAARSSFLSGGVARIAAGSVCGVKASLRRRHAGGVKTSAVGPNEVNELAGAALLTLSGAEAILGKVSFGSLLTATSIYEYKVSVGAGGRGGGKTRVGYPLTRTSIARNNTVAGAGRPIERALTPPSSPAHSIPFKDTFSFFQP